MACLAISCNMPMLIINSMQQTDRPRSKNLTKMVSTILQRVAAGDKSAVRVFVDRYKLLVWSLAKRYSPNQAEASDAVQDVFVELWEKAERFDPSKATEKTFVVMIARRRLIERLRQRGRQVPAEVCNGGAVSKPDKLVKDETVSKAKSALCTLPEAQQQVIKHSIYGGLTHAQIAEKLGIPLGTVKTHARRGLIKLREAIQADTVMEREVSA